MAHAIRIHETGGPEVLRWEEVGPGTPGPGQVRVRHTAIGLNFIDTYHRSGLYKLPLPTSIGRDSAVMSNFSRTKWSFSRAISSCETALRPGCPIVGAHRGRWDWATDPMDVHTMALLQT